MALPDLAGNNPRNARPIAVTSSPITLRDSLDRRDRADFYRFTARSSINLNGVLNGIRRGANIDFQVRKQGGGVVLSSRTRGNRKTVNGELDAGTYLVRVFHRTGDTNYRLRLSAAPIIIGDPPPRPLDLAGNTPATARPIAVTPTPATFSDAVNSTTDSTDYYVFTLTDKITQVDTSFTGLTGGSISASVRNLNDQFLQSVNTDGSSSKTLLNAGTYYLRVTGTANYNLNISGLSIPDNAGETLPQARSISLSPTSTTFSDFIDGDVDVNDYYAFTLTEKTTRISASVTGVTGSLGLSIRDVNDQFIQSIDNDGSTDEFLLAAGTYYLRVNGDFNSTNYNLNLAGVAISDTAGDNPTQARDIGALTSTPVNFNDFVGTGDNRDYYKFTLAARSTVNATTLTSPAVPGAGQSISLAIVDENDGFLRSISDPTGSTTLDPGTYYFRVSQSFSDPNYALTLFTSPATT
ncbi:MAG: hypothetical protein HC769_22560 [Cyanobacteria bacterium CRU_2_1]|nr:hypothetical protein [Cyanobacteria bacterium RU_5_0]NJR61366.1 hypothetical protein [Cyanobacteria bacterium CRU_2_1]